MSKHTPGPWLEIDGRILPQSYLLTGAPIATVHARKKSGMQKANARLIAAAPDLLEALRVCATQSTGPDWTPEQALAFIKQYSRAAIVKAEDGAA